MLNKHFNRDNNHSTTTNESVETLVVSLRDHIADLKEENSVKNAQIETLQKLFDQQQQLNAEDKQLIKEFCQQLALEAPVPQEESDQEEGTDTAEATQRIQELEARLAETKAALIDQNEENQRVHQEMNQLQEKNGINFGNSIKRPS